MISNSRNGVLSGLTILLLSMPAWAGNHLHLKAGSVDPSYIMPANSSGVAGTTVASGLDEMGIETSYFVIQFESQITEKQKLALKKRGIHSYRYIPDDALLVKADAEALEDLLAADEGVRAVAPYLPEWRISSNFNPVSVFNSDDTQDVAFRILDAKLRPRVTAALEAMGVDAMTVNGEKTFVVRIKNRFLYDLAALEGVEWVHPYAPMSTFDFPIEVNSADLAAAEGDYKDLTGFETGTKVMNFGKAWERGFRGQGQIVAMADTGLDSGVLGSLHQDFENVIGGKAFGMFMDNWSDPMGHGTHVAGSVMSSGKASGGAFKGGAFGASMFAEGMWSKLLKNLTVPPELKDLFVAAYDKGARIHTNSWGGASAGKYDSFAQQVDEYTWANQDMLILFAAGNSGVDDDKDGRIDADSIGSPGTAKNVMTVGASENYLLEGGIQRTLGELAKGKPWSVEPLKSDKLSDDAGGIAAFSSRGPTDDGRLKPDIVAPGTNIVSNCSQVADASPLWGNYSKDYCYSGGTSMSTPLTAGAAAVARQFLIAKGYEQPSSALVKGWLMHTATDLYPGQYGMVGKAAGQELLVAGPNHNQGYGRVDMDRATIEDHIILIADEKLGVATGKNMEFVFDMANKEISKLKVTLVYTDAPAAAAATKTLVNDLDIEVLIDGRLMESSSDRINNSEQLILSGLDAGSALGELKVRIKGHNIPQGKQGKQSFALMVSSI